MIEKADEKSAKLTNFKLISEKEKVCLLTRSEFFGKQWRTNSLNNGVRKLGDFKKRRKKTLRRKYVYKYQKKPYGRKRHSLSCCLGSAA